MNYKEIEKHFESIFKIFKNIDIMIAGGSLISLLNDTSVNDYDIFFKSENDYNKAKKLLINNRNYIHTFIGPNGNKYTNDKYTFDLVHSIFFKNKTDLINHFDFTINQIAIDKNGIVYSNRFEDDFKNKKLVLNNIPIPGSTLKRLVKYLNKDYKINNTELEKLYKAIKDTDLEFPKNEESIPFNDITDNVFDILLNLLK